MSDPAAWLLGKTERANTDTRLDDRHEGDVAWSEGNLARPLVDGASYFARLHEVLSATRAGDLVLLTDWQGDADELLTGEPGSEVLEVLAQADERGVDVRGLVWRSHLDQAGFFATSNRHLGEQLQARGAEVLLDMRVRAGGSHHQKFVVVRHRDDPARDVAFVGGIDLAHNRRDDSRHHGDPQGRRLSPEYGDTPPWHDAQVELRGPVVHDVETVFRERWDDPTPLSSAPWRRVADRLRRLDTTPDPLPPQLPPPPPAGDHVVQLLRTYPDLRLDRDYPFARGGERSVARGYSKAVGRAERIVYIEDQYFWGHDVAGVFEQRLADQPELRLLVVIPLATDVTGFNRTAQLLGRRRALRRLERVAPGRVAAYGIENHAGTPIYVHAKVCVVDDTWASTGSDNFNRRSWTHDSELTAVVLDDDYARDLRLRLAAEHLDRLDLLDPARDGTDLVDVMADCLDPADMFERYAEHARRLEEWHAAGQEGERPPGRLRPLPLPSAPPRVQPLARALLAQVHDPDGRPGGIRGSRHY
ncbi:phospholipase D-like domain-containing protein [Nocardioides sp. CPCC 205120]|uniref:phospholipase D-like domain-containing protein n=1 Tax=Nocardioides sp. CPCC 205120 TaxID=3406462 RepID=UPI003B5058AB